jgi:anthraniloyl-CoA monooxygenase
MGFRDIAWPRQYLAGKAQLERNLQRERAVEAPEARIV